MTDTPVTKAPPALFLHCSRAYEAMLNEATKAVADGETEIIIWEGYATQLITGQLNLSTPYYTSVFGALQNMGCVKQLRRGGGSTKSQWELIKEPDFELFEAQDEKKVTRPSRQDATDDQILALSARISDLEEWQQSVNEFLVNKFGTEEASNG
jgi:hypothetical protein